MFVFDWYFAFLGIMSGTVSYFIFPFFRCWTRKNKKKKSWEEQAVDSKREVSDGRWGGPGDWSSQLCWSVSLLPTGCVSPLWPSRQLGTKFFFFFFFLPLYSFDGQGNTNLFVFARVEENEEQKPLMLAFPSAAEKNTHMRRPPWVSSGESGSSSGCNLPRNSNDADFQTGISRPFDMRYMFIKLLLSVVAYLYTHTRPSKRIHFFFFSCPDGKQNKEGEDHPDGIVE